MPFSVTVVVAFDMIGGFGTVIFVVVVTAGCVVVVVCFVVAFGFAVVVALVVVVAALCVVRIVVVADLGCSVIGAADVVIDVVALTGSHCADTGLLSVGCVVSRLVLSVADVGAVRVVVALFVVVVTAGVCVVVLRVVVALLSDVVTLSVGFSLSVIVIADDEVVVVVTTSAPGSVFAQPDSRAASISIAIAFFISVTTFDNVTHQLCSVAEALLVAALVADRGLLALDVAESVEQLILLGGQRFFEFFVQPQPLFAETDVPAVRIELHIYRRSVAVVDILDGHKKPPPSTTKDTTPAAE